MYVRIQILQKHMDSTRIGSVILHGTGSRLGKLHDRCGMRHTGVFEALGSIWKGTMGLRWKFKKINFFLLVYIIITTQKLNVTFFSIFDFFTKIYGLFVGDIWRNLNLLLCTKQRALWHLENTSTHFWNKLK